MVLFWGSKVKVTGSISAFSHCLEHNSKTNDPKVFKLGVGNDLGIGSAWYGFGFLVERSRLLLQLLLLLLLFCFFKVPSLVKIPMVKSEEIKTKNLEELEVRIVDSFETFVQHCVVALHSHG